MQKENVIEIKEEVKIGDVILEAGDKIRVINESGQRADAPSELKALGIMGVYAAENTRLIHLKGNAYIEVDNHGNVSFYVNDKAVLDLGKNVIDTY